MIIIVISPVSATPLLIICSCSRWLRLKLSLEEKIRPLLSWTRITLASAHMILRLDIIIWIQTSIQHLNPLGRAVELILNPFGGKLGF